MGKNRKTWPCLMRFAGKLFGKSDAVERLVSSLTIDSSKIRRELGWKPPYTMVEGLKETAVWFKTLSHVSTTTDSDKRWWPIKLL